MKKPFTGREPSANKEPSADKEPSANKQPSADKPPLAENLELLCSYYKSTSEVCRRLGINRSQFNKYLNGSSQPSRNTLHKLCNFFGVEPHEIYLPAHQFANIVQVRPRHEVQPQELPEHVKVLEQLQEQSLGSLDKYTGFYFEYYYSMSFPGKILRSLIHIEQRDGNTYFDRYERLKKRHQSRADTGFNCHYQGVVFHLVDRLFMVDCESLTKNEITQTILYPSYKSRMTYLTGLKLGVAAQFHRTPVCVRVVYEVLGTNVNVRAALKMCGLFEPQSEEIADEVKQLLAVQTQGDEYYFMANTP
jgi:transcriptional regulator with XRE-family HTH domain